MKTTFKTKIVENFRQLQTWADREKYVIPVFRRNSYSDEFVERVEREIEAVIERESFRIKDNQTVIPTGYTVLISEKTSEQWYGIKREYLLQKLNAFVKSHLIINSQPSFEKHFVIIEPSSELKENEILIIHNWEDAQLPINIMFYDQASARTSAESAEEAEVLTAACSREHFNCGGAESETVLKSKMKRLFGLEIWRDGRHQGSVPIFRPQITIGRGSKFFSVDIKLEDLEVSRLHAILWQEPNDFYNFFVKGKNPVIARNKVILPNQKLFCQAGETFQIGSYSLKIQN